MVDRKLYSCYKNRYNLKQAMINKEVFMSTKKIRVLVSGACGKMGSEVVKAVSAESDMEIVALVDIVDDMEVRFCENLKDSVKGVSFESNLSKALASVKPDVAVDFTNPLLVYDNTIAMISAGVSPVIGTTGLTVSEVQEIIKISKKEKIGGLIAPNFAIGAVLMMQFAKKASQYFDNAEIVELHHNNKLDAPSGTAIKTAELMEEEQEIFGQKNVKDKELIQGARGAVSKKNIHIHSVRLPGLVAHQEVYLAGSGQMLTIRHDSFDRTSFMPGVVKAIRSVVKENQVLYGLENIL